MSTPVSVCPSCDHNAFARLVDLGGQPLSGLYLEHSDIVAPATGLALEFCSKCSFVRKKKLPSSERRYEEIDRPTANQLPYYSSRIIADILRGQSPGDPLLEIGANDGTFMDELVRHGFSSISGIEPSPKLVETCRAGGHRVICGYFDAASAHSVVQRHERPKTILCRHTLEHVPDPGSFLKAALAVLAPGGRLYVEVPDTTSILERLQIHEIWDEHENYFTPRTLKAALESSGFGDVECRVQRHRDAYNICCWAHNSGERREDAPLENVETELGLCEGFEARFGALKDAVISVARTFDSPAWLIGAGHNQANYVQFMEIGDFVAGFVDDAHWKQGRFLSVPATRAVISTETVCNIKTPCTLLATAFPHPKWMERIQSARREIPDRWVTPYPQGFPQPDVDDGGQGQTP